MRDKKLDYAFHVHTARCGHASSDTEEDYIKYAIKNGMRMITFTDHIPFPGDPFTGRMKMSELDGYIYVIDQLKEKYKKQIEVYTGFEVEYIPEYLSYYREVRKKVDIMILGQHHAKMENGCYTFERNVDKNKICRLAKTECIKLERNLGVYEKTGYNMNFWSNLPSGVQTIYGLDAHSLDGMKLCEQVTYSS